MEQQNEAGPVIHYKALRRTIGVLGFFLPIVVGLGAWFLFKEGLQPSLSEYYYTHMRNVFIGAIWAIGFFLYSYKGFGNTENLIGNAAGACAIIVSLAPARPRIAEPIQIQQIAGWIHVASASAFFIILSVYTAFFFTKPEEGDTLSEQEHKRNRTYQICAAIMFICVIAIGLYHLTEESWRTNMDLTVAPVFWLETVTIMVFGIAWLVKGEAPPFRPRNAASE